MEIISQSVDFGFGYEVTNYATISFLFTCIILLILWLKIINLAYDELLNYESSDAEDYLFFSAITLLACPAVICLIGLVAGASNFIVTNIILIIVLLAVLHKNWNNIIDWFKESTTKSDKPIDIYKNKLLNL